MRDGMPAPGWWIASDGRWYPPELHPDVRAAVAVAPTALAGSAEMSTSSAFDHHRDNSTNGTTTLEPTASTNGTTTLEPAASTNGTTTLEPTASTNGTPAPFAATAAPTATATTTVTAEKPSVGTSARPRKVRADGTNHPRGAFGVALALGTLAVIISAARGHDVRPTLDRSLPTTTLESPAPTTSPAPGPVLPTSPATPSASSAPTTAPARGATTVPTSAARVTPRIVSVFDLVKGNCLDGSSLSDGLVTTIRVVDCAEVHTHEVYYSGRYPEATFDATKIANYANDTCLAQFAPYVGIDYTRSRYQYLHIVPTQESWTRDNDRDVVCVAFEEDATITGTIANRAQ